ncbi:MAG: hypothetical protein ACLR8P_22640 [Clostridium fessum]
MQLCTFRCPVGFSSSGQTGKDAWADDFDGKVQVADSARGPRRATQRRSVQDALDMAAAGMDGGDLQKLEETGWIQLFISRLTH